MDDKICYSFQNNFRLVTSMSQLYPVHTLTTHLCNMHLNVSFYLDLCVQRGLLFPFYFTIGMIYYAFIIFLCILYVQIIPPSSAGFLYLIRYVKRITVKKAKVFEGLQSQEVSK
jgi:hypothetical protein